jgi:RNA polymerase sigma-70 factor, ECF subfamily
MDAFEPKVDDQDRQARDRQSLATLWEQARPALFAYMTAAVYDFHRAEDLLQEVAVAVAGQFHSYDSQRPFLAWAMGIARNRVLLYFREQARDRRHFSDAAIVALEGAAERMPRDQASDQREALRHCLGKIIGRRRRVLEMRYGGNLSIADIAKQLSVTGNAVKILLHRVRASLEECIRRQLAQERTSS